MTFHRRRNFGPLALLLGGASFAVACGESGNVLEGPSDDAGGSSGTLTSSSSSSSSGAPAPLPTGDGFGTTEVWDVVAAERSGSVRITPGTIDFTIGEFEANILLAADDSLTMTWRENGGEPKTYTGARWAPVPSVELGLTGLRVGGSWRLGNADRTLSATIGVDQQTFSCLGLCVNATDENVQVARTSTVNQGVFGSGNGLYAARGPETPPGESVDVALATNAIHVTGAQISFDAEWDGERMSGTIDGTQEFSAEKRP